MAATLDELKRKSILPTLPRKLLLSQSGGV